MAVVYIYKFVLCKGCGSQIDVEYLGPAVNARIAGIIREPGHLRCLRCEQSHAYVESDTNTRSEIILRTGGVKRLAEAN